MNSDVGKHLERWLNYYRTSLIEGRQRSYTDMVYLERIMVDGELRIDRLSLEEQEVLLKDKLNRQTTLWEKAKKEEKPFTISVEIAPLSFIEEWEGGSRQVHYPFWIPAILDKEGALSPPEEEETPLILRGYLSPNADDKPILATLEEFDLQLRETPFTSTSWQSYWEECETFFEQVTGKSFSDYHPQAGRIQMAIVLADQGNYIRHIKDLYTFLIKKTPKRIPYGPFQHILSPPQDTYPLTKDDIYKETTHWGQFQQAFPLSFSQRKALASFFHEKTGPILAVSGPPGTGKTTLLQSVIAHLVVKHVWEDKPPPLIVGCSNSNQAIRNILDSMQLGGATQDPILANRWLKGLDSLGLYLTSQKNVKDPEFEQYLRISDSWFQGGSLKQIDSKKLADSFETHFVECYHRYQPQSASEHQDLSGIKKALKALVKGKMETLQQFFPDSASPSLLKKYAEEADTTLRYELFWLCIHIRELEFIELLKAKEEEDKERGKDSFRAKLRRIARVCPLFISTFYTLPRYSTFYGREGQAYFTSLYDLMIVDEAGQVSPEVAWPSFSLAKQLLVVGDEHQLEPIWGLSPQVDYANAKRYQLLKNRIRFKVHAERGLMVSSGNVMKMAKAASRIVYTLSKQKSIVRGALLTEHRRCLNDIMEFSNTYVYQNSLDLLVGNDHGMAHKLPPLAYFDIPGKAEKYKSSRRNQEEAMAIANWIGSQKEDWEAIYQTDLSKILGIITPFVAQKFLIYQYLKERLGLEFDKTWKIGTVHALQGAERPIVIFSPVYHSTYGTLFFDQDNKYNMLNVALSRAQHSFIIMGNTKIFDSGDDNPSGNLGRILFAKKENRLNERFVV